MTRIASDFALIASWIWLTICPGSPLASVWLTCHTLSRPVLASHCCSPAHERVSDCADICWAMTATLSGLAAWASAGVEVRAKLASCEAPIIPMVPPRRSRRESVDFDWLSISLSPFHAFFLAFGRTLKNESRQLLPLTVCVVANNGRMNMRCVWLASEGAPSRRNGSTLRAGVAAKHAGRLGRRLREAGYYAGGRRRTLSSVAAGRCRHWRRGRSARAAAPNERRPGPRLHR